MSLSAKRSEWGHKVVLPLKTRTYGAFRRGFLSRRLGWSTALHLNVVRGRSQLVFAGAQSLLEKIRPVLHHPCSRNKIFRVIVRAADLVFQIGRSEERRVGKECRSRWS